ncbi:MAG: acyltransferase [Actinomycetales bacterium]|nr:MAG: acyltransferase [Actinomycetales bacterium]
MDSFSASQVPSSRLHGLDALRGAALLLGILLHGLMAYAPGDLWLVNDDQEAFWVVGVIGPIHMFRMALFLMLAGYLGRRSLRKRGTRNYLFDRFKRLVLPLFAFWPIAVLSLVVFIVIDAQRRGVQLPPQQPGFPTGQLWFLWVLFECTLIVVLVSWLIHRIGWGERIEAMLQKLAQVLVAPGGVLLAAIPFALAMWLQNAKIGIESPFGLTPELDGLVGYGGAFLVGWVLSTRQDALNQLKLGWPIYLVIAALGSVAILLEPQIPFAFWVIIYGVAAWCWVYGLVGSTLKFLNQEYFWVRYLADASYWMYLLHLPLLLAIEVLIAGLAWPVVLKLIVVLVPTTAILLFSYDLVVRSTWIGGWLNSRRYPRELVNRLGSAYGRRENLH